MQLIPTECAICHTRDQASEIYPANFSLEDFSKEVFSARRLPDRIHYRLVRCNNCGLVRSDPVVDAQTLSSLYAQSAQTYDAEVHNLTESYLRYLRLLNKFNPSRGSLLEIGCGSGFFLEKALDDGYASVMGVEPSQQAVAQCSPRLKGSILCDMMHPGLFEADQFDVICLFQVFDHINAPADLLKELLRVLKPRGLVLCYNHDVAALSARLLGESSPIVDIEHTYLYSQATIRKLFTQSGYKVLETGSGMNIYSLRYLFQLLPLPGALKKTMLAFLRSNPVGKIRLPVWLGNLYVVASKP